MGSLCCCFRVNDHEDSSLSNSNNNEGCKCPNCRLHALLNKLLHKDLALQLRDGDHTSPEGAKEDGKLTKLERLDLSLKSPIKISEPEDDDFCPTCLEEYTLENPKIVTQCCHHYHLSCIYEWIERSPTCPICSKVMVFDETT